MKKLTLSLLGAAALVMTSCSSDDPQKASDSAGRLVTFGVSLPENINSRAISDGTAVEDLHWAVFSEDGDLLEEFSKPGAFAGSNKRTQVQLRLVNGKNYKVAFWAQHPDAPYTFADGKVSVSYDAGKKAANDEKRDAFYKVYGSFTCTSTFAPEGDILLTRPFAQVNVGTADWATATAHGAVPTKTGMKVTATAYTSLNLFDGSVQNPVAVEYDLAALPDNDGDAATVDNLRVTKADGTYSDYAWIGMNYLLVPAASETITTVTFKHDFANGETAFNQIPVKRNFRTNIVGNILTSASDWQIVIDEVYETPDYNEINP